MPGREPVAGCLTSHHLGFEPRIWPPRVNSAGVRTSRALLLLGVAAAARLLAQREIRLFAALDDAVDRGDAARVRALVAAHRDTFPVDTQHLRAGYAAI